MKTKTTLAALLLAAVIVTPSHGADEAFLLGSADNLNEKTNWSDGYFSGYCRAMYDAGLIGIGSGVKAGQLYTTVARYVCNHPHHHHLSNKELVQRACKEAWPKENKYVLVSK